MCGHILSDAELNGETEHGECKFVNVEEILK
jgi:hypothetical protein